MALYEKCPVCFPLCYITLDATYDAQVSQLPQRVQCVGCLMD